MDGHVKRVTHLFIGSRLDPIASLRRPHAPDPVGDDVAKLEAGVRRFRSVKSQHTIEERDLRSHLHHLALLGVEIALGRGDEQPQEYGGHGRDKAHGQFYGVLGVRAELILGKVTTDTPS
jgi:hypothetical protein